MCSLSSLSTKPAKSDPSVAPSPSSLSLEPDVRKYFENRLFEDFSRVRVHTDQTAAAQAEALGAKAFTVGNDIAFAEGRYNPGTTEGRRLLAHELTHVAQQGRGSAATTNAESRAHAAADQVAQGSSVSAEAQGGASMGVQCDDDEKKKEDVTPAPNPTPAPAATPAATPTPTPGGISFGALGLPGLGSGFQFKPPQLGTPQLTPPTLTPPFSGSLLPGAEGPMPLPQWTPPFLPPLTFETEPKVDWLSLQKSYSTRGSIMSPRDADAIMQTWEMNSQLLSTLGIDDKFKFLFITKEWILNTGIQKQVEDTQARENPSALDKAQKEWKTAYPDAFETPIVPIFDLNWFRSEKKK
jgi:Domain of unknown function (DUF4157)